MPPPPPAFSPPNTVLRCQVGLISPLAGGRERTLRYAPLYPPPLQVHAGRRCAIREHECNVEFELTRLWECGVRSGSQGGSLGLGMGDVVVGVEVKLVLAGAGFGVGCALDGGEGEIGKGCIGGAGGCCWGGAWRTGEDRSGEALGEIGVDSCRCGSSDSREQGALAGVVGGSSADTGDARGRVPTVVAKNAWIGSAVTTAGASRVPRCCVRYCVRRATCRGATTDRLYRAQAHGRYSLTVSRSSGARLITR